MKILGFIPARGGSKGIPGKNLVPLRGKPMVQYAIEEAKTCSLVNAIFLSSDDEGIIEVGRLCGLRSDYRRPERISGDRAQVIDAVLDALTWLEARGEFFDAVVLLQPTSPLRIAADIDGAVRMFLETKAETLISAHEMVEHPFECIKQREGGWQWLDQPRKVVAGRQDYDRGYVYVNGAIYIAKVEFLRARGGFIDDGKTQIYLMPSIRGLDVDTPDQLRLAEFLLAERLQDAVG